MPPKGSTKNSSCYSCHSHHRNRSINSFHSDATSEKEPDQAQQKKADDWIEVTRQKKKSPKKAEDKFTSASPAKEMEPAPAKATTSAIFIPRSVTAPIPAHITEHPPTTKARKKAKSKPVSTTSHYFRSTRNTRNSNGDSHKSEEEKEQRRRSRQESMFRATLPWGSPGSNAFPQKPPPQQVPLHLSFPPPLLSLPPPLLPLPPLPPLTLPPLPPPPQYQTPPEQQCSQPSQSPELLHHPPQPPKTRPHQILHMARSQSQDRLSPQNLLRTFSLPSLSPSSSPELLPAASPAATPAEKEPVTEPATADSAPRRSRRKAKATNQDFTEEPCRKAVAMCTVGLESVTDHQLRKSLKPLLNLEKVNGKRVCNPSNFRGAPMVTTFIRSAGDRSKGVWKVLDTVRQTNTGVELAELEHPSLKRCLPYCTGRVQELPNDYWTRLRFVETGCWHPHHQGFPAHRRHWLGKCTRMALNVASLNARGLRDASKCAHLLAELSNLCVDVAAVQETHFVCGADCRVLEDDFVVYSAFSSLFGAGVSLLVGHSLDAVVNVVFAGDRGRLLVADVAVKTFEFRIAAVHMPNSAVERRSFLQWLGSFLEASRWTVLVGDWNAILDPNIDKVGRGASSWARCDSGLSDFLTEFDPVDKYRLDHPGREMWTWIGSLPSGQVRSYLDRVFVSRADSDLVAWPMFHWLGWSDHKLVRVSLRLVNRPSLASYWKFNTSLLEIWDFWMRLENLIQRSLVGAVTGNKWWASLKYRIRDFAIKYSQQLALDRAKKAKSLEGRLSRAVEGGGLRSHRSS